MCLDPNNIADLNSNPNNSVPDDIAKALANLKRRTTLYQRIPKPMRGSLAGILSDSIQDVLVHPTKQSWWNLFTFSYSYLQVAKAEPNTANPTAAQGIQSNISNFDEITKQLKSLSVAKEPRNAKKKPIKRKRDTADSGEEDGNDSENFRKRVLSKIIDGDVRSALRLLTSNDAVMKPDAETIEKLREKHPSAPPGPLTKCTVTAPSLSYNKETVLSAINTMQSGSGCGIDGLRPLVIQQLLSQSAHENGNKLLASLTKLTNLILKGETPGYITHALFGASLCIR